MPGAKGRVGPDRSVCVSAQGSRCWYYRSVILHPRTGLLWYQMPPRGRVSERPIRMQKICGHTRHSGRHFIARDKQSLQLEASGRSDDRASRLSDALLSGWFGGGSAKEPTSGPVTEAEMA